MPLLPDSHGSSGRRTTSPTICHWQRLVEVTGVLHALGLPHYTAPRSLTQVLPTPVSNDKKAPKCSWVTATTDFQYQAQYSKISGKATNMQKHCLKKCQIPSLTHSSVCFQIRRSSVSSSRDQFDGQILLILKYIISLCKHALSLRVVIRI